MNVENVGWSAHDQHGGYSLPSRYFYDPGVFDREKARIFLKSWHLVAHLNELREPGSFVTRDIFEQSVIVIAGRAGEIRAFHNVCQHRGNRLVGTRRGKSPTLTCGYHAWSYGLDGCLRGAPNVQGVTGFRKSDHGLKPVRVEIFASFVFINLDGNAKPIARMAPGADPEIRRFIPDLDRLKLIEEVDVPVPANWKVIQENSIEGYHFEHSGPAHKQLVQLIEFSGYTLQPHGDWWTYVGPPKKRRDPRLRSCARGSHVANGLVFQFRTLAECDDLRLSYADMVGTFIMMPTGPESPCCDSATTASRAGSSPK